MEKQTNGTIADRLQTAARESDPVLDGHAIAWDWYLVNSLTRVFDDINFSIKIYILQDERNLG